MKHFQPLWIGGIVLSLVLAQRTSDLIVVSETGEPFRLYLNGEWVLSQPGTRAEVHDLHEGLHKGTIYIYPSEGRAIQLKRTFPVEADFIEYYAIRKNRKGQYTVTIYNRVPKADDEPVPPPPPMPVSPSMPTTPNQPIPQGSPGGQVQTNSQNQTIIFNPTIQIQTGGGGTQVGSSGGTGQPGNPQPPIYTGPTYTGPCNCQQPMGREAFQRALTTVQSQTFDNTRMDIAKGIARSNCLLASDVKALTAAFQFENNRLEFAKFAYDYTLDLSHYFEVAGAFDFEHTRTELMSYIQRRGARQTCQAVPLQPVSGAVWPGQPVPGGGMPPQPPQPTNPPTGTATCQPCMAPEAFANALRTIQNTASDMTRLEIAKSLLVSNCLSAVQVREITRAFSSEAHRLDFAKTAYRRCCDPGNYILVNEAFASTLSREELARYIQSVGR